MSDTLTPSHDISGLLTEALRLGPDAALRGIGEGLAQAFGDGFVTLMSGESYVHRFAAHGHCRVNERDGVFSQTALEYHARHEVVTLEPFFTWWSVEWEGHPFEVVTVSQSGYFCRNVTTFLVGRTEESVKTFYGTLWHWRNEVRGEVLVYQEGWHPDADLLEGIRNTTFDSLILAGGLKDEIRGDFRRFFDLRETYERHGIPWKRGVLFLGPPGNGKTHTIKALVNDLGVPALYVRTFEREYGTAQKSMSEVFERARNTAPCLLILEDVDALINDENRSFFLNEVDGFATNTGVMIVATTNHPERLDPAILNRPSRFDRKVTFALPEEPERRAFLKTFGERLEESLRLGKPELDRVVQVTANYSYAYLKELYLSAMMAWISEGGNEPFVMVMLRCADMLLTQIATEEPVPLVVSLHPLIHRFWQRR